MTARSSKSTRWSGDRRVAGPVEDHEREPLGQRRCARPSGAPADAAVNEHDTAPSDPTRCTTWPVVSVSAKPCGFWLSQSLVCSRRNGPAPRLAVRSPPGRVRSSQGRPPQVIVGRSSAGPRLDRDRRARRRVLGIPAGASSSIAATGGTSRDGASRRRGPCRGGCAGDRRRLVIALALPVFLVAGWPLAGWALAAVLWLAGQALALLLARLRSGWVISPALACGDRDDVSRGRRDGRRDRRRDGDRRGRRRSRPRSSTRSPTRSSSPSRCRLLRRGGEPHEARARPRRAGAARSRSSPSRRASGEGEVRPSHEFEQHAWIPIHIGPLDLSITKAVAYLMLGSSLTMALGIVLMRVKLGVSPNGARRSASRSTRSPRRRSPSRACRRRRSRAGSPTSRRSSSSSSSST